MGEINLRLTTEKDIDDYVRWFLYDTEWMDFDAPWEKYDQVDIDVLKEKKLRQISLKSIDTLEIYLDEIHIGWVTSYLIDDEYHYSSNGKNLTIGIDIPEGYYQGKGYGTKALDIYLTLLLEEYDKIFLQTWSGNKRMIHVAEKLGFKIVNQYHNVREVDGLLYDALTFVIEK